MPCSPRHPMHVAPAIWTRVFERSCDADMRAVDTGVLVRPLVRDDPGQVETAEAFVAGISYLREQRHRGICRNGMLHVRSPSVGFRDIDARPDRPPRNRESAGRGRDRSGSRWCPRGSDGCTCPHARLDQCARVLIPQIIRVIVHKLFSRARSSGVRKQVLSRAECADAGQAGAGVEHDDGFDDVATPPFSRSRLPGTCGARPERSVKNSRPSLHTSAEPPAFSASSARNASSSPTSSGQP